MPEPRKQAQACQGPRKPKRQPPWANRREGPQKCQFTIQFGIQFGNFRIQGPNFWGFLGATGQIRMTRNHVNSPRISLYYCYIVAVKFFPTLITIICVLSAQMPAPGKNLARKATHKKKPQEKVPKHTFCTIQVFCVVTFKLELVLPLACWVTLLIIVLRPVHGTTICASWMPHGYMYNVDATIRDSP